MDVSSAAGRTPDVAGESGALQILSGTLPALAGDLLAIMFVTVSTLLLNTTGIELATRSEANIERDLKVLGRCQYRNGRARRICQLYVAQPLDPHPNSRRDRSVRRLYGRGDICCDAHRRSFISWLVPKFILAGLLLFLGAGVHQWIVQSARQMPLIDYLSLLAIALLIINWGFVAGVLIGVVIGCATFALSASRVNAIKFGFDGSEYRSSLDRSSQEQALFADHGREIQGMALQSYLFFGRLTGSISTSRRCWRGSTAAVS